MGVDRHLQIPQALAQSSLITIRHASNAGLGVFAAQDIAAGTQLLTTHKPAVHVVYRHFRKEVCAWCFRYERGRTWKVRFFEDDVAQTVEGEVIKTNGKYYREKAVQTEKVLGKGRGKLKTTFNGGGLVFDTEACRDQWKAEYGSIGLESYVALESFIQKQSRKPRDRPLVDEEDAGGQKESQVPDEQAIEQAWSSVEHRARLIRGHRLHDTEQHLHKELQKLQARALLDALRLPTSDPDLIVFLLSGILCRHGAKSEWSALLALLPTSRRYSSTAILTETTYAYLQLLALLPTTLISSDPDIISRSTIEAIMSRDTGNSFGIWSTQASYPDDDDGRKSGDEDHGDEDPEMLGYAIYPIASFFNHSCSPTVHKQREGRSWVFSALPAPEAALKGKSNSDGGGLLREGDELCITYIRGEEDTLPLKERRQRLQVGWGFECQCVKCMREAESSKRDKGEET